MNTYKTSVTRYSPGADEGLDSLQVKERVSAGLVNTPAKPPGKSVRDIIADNLFTYFNLIFLILALLVVYAGTYRDLTFVPIIAANTLIGIVQELRSKKVLDKLTMLHAPVTRVIREGAEQTIPSCDAVLDDIAVFRAGDQITADAQIVTGTVSVNEALLTGESDEITKSVGDTLMSGSFVVSGNCCARLDKVGAQSYISRLTIQAKQMKKGEQSEMIRSLNRIVKLVGIIIIPLGIMLFCQQYIIEGTDKSTSIQSMVAAILGMIPEGLFLLASTTLAISAMSLARNRVLVHDMKCIETLARADVLCVDKTGTITEADMSVSEIVPLSDDFTDEELSGLLSDFVSAQSADNATMAAMKNHFCTPTGRQRMSVTGFSPEFKYSSVTFREGAYVLGAPEFLLSPESMQKVYSEIRNRRGSRVLLLGRVKNVPEGRALDEGAEPICLVVLENPVRSNAPDTFRFFAEQGVQIKVISGDEPMTVSLVAKQAGISGAENYVDASTLTTARSLEDAASRYTVFGRVTPEQKRGLIAALKSAGHTVAMTGDGVNDVLALKDADCSIAMASGSEAAAQASQLVLLDSDFSKMPEVVMEGRKVVNNLERSGSLFLVKNVFSLLLALTSLFLSMTYPLKPANVSLVSMFTIGIPAFLLSQIPNRELIRGRFLKNILLKAIPAGITDTVIVCAMVFFGSIFGADSGDIATASTILLSAVGLMIVYSISKPMNSVKWGIWLFCAAGLAVCMVFVSDFFAISSMSVQCVLLCVNFSIIAEPLLRYLTRFTEFLNRRTL